MRISDWSSDVCSSDLVAARVDALDDRAAAVVVEALPHDANTLDLLRGQGGKIDVDEGARCHLHRQQRRQHLRAPRLGRLEGNGVAHALAGIDLAQRDGGDARSEEHTSELQSLMRTSYAV